MKDLDIPMNYHLISIWDKLYRALQKYLPPVDNQQNQQNIVNDMPECISYPDTFLFNGSVMKGYYRSHNDKKLSNYMAPNYKIRFAAGAIYQILVEGHPSEDSTIVAVMQWTDTTFTSLCKPRTKYLNRSQLRQVLLNIDDDPGSDDEYLAIGAVHKGIPKLWSLQKFISSNDGNNHSSILVARKTKAGLGYHIFRLQNTQTIDNDETFTFSTWELEEPADIDELNVTHVTKKKIVKNLSIAAEVTITAISEYISNDLDVRTPIEVYFRIDNVNNTTYIMGADWIGTRPERRAFPTMLPALKGWLQSPLGQSTLGSYKILQTFIFNRFRPIDFYYSKPNGEIKCEDISALPSPAIFDRIVDNVPHQGAIVAVLRWNEGQGTGLWRMRSRYLNRYDLDDLLHSLDKHGTFGKVLQTGPTDGSNDNINVTHPPNFWVLQKYVPPNLNERHVTTVLIQHTRAKDRGVDENDVWDGSEDTSPWTFTYMINREVYDTEGHCTRSCCITSENEDYKYLKKKKMTYKSDGDTYNLVEMTANTVASAMSTYMHCDVRKMNWKMSLQLWDSDSGIAYNGMDGVHTHHTNTHGYTTGRGLTPLILWFHIPHRNLSHLSSGPWAMLTDNVRDSIHDTEADNQYLLPGEGNPDTLYGESLEITPNSNESSERDEVDNDNFPESKDHSDINMNSVDVDSDNSGHGEGDDKVEVDVDSSATMENAYVFGDSLDTGGTYSHNDSSYNQSSATDDVNTHDIYAAPAPSITTVKEETESPFDVVLEPGQANADEWVPTPHRSPSPRSFTSMISKSATNTSIKGRMTRFASRGDEDSDFEDDDDIHELDESADILLASPEPTTFNVPSFTSKNEKSENTPTATSTTTPTVNTKPKHTDATTEAEDAQQWIRTEKKRLQKELMLASRGNIKEDAESPSPNRSMSPRRVPDNEDYSAYDKASTTKGPVLATASGYAQDLIDVEDTEVEFEVDLDSDDSDDDIHLEDMMRHIKERLRGMKKKLKKKREKKQRRALERAVQSQADKSEALSSPHDPNDASGDQSQTSGPSQLDLHQASDVKTYAEVYPDDSDGEGESPLKIIEKEIKMDKKNKLMKKAKSRISKEEKIHKELQKIDLAHHPVFSFEREFVGAGSPALVAPGGALENSLTGLGPEAGLGIASGSKDKSGTVTGLDLHGQATVSVGDDLRQKISRASLTRSLLTMKSSNLVANHDSDLDSDSDSDSIPDDTANVNAEHSSDWSEISLVPEEKLDKPQDNQTGGDEQKQIEPDAQEVDDDNMIGEVKKNKKKKKAADPQPPDGGPPSDQYRPSSAGARTVRGSQLEDSDSDGEGKGKGKSKGKGRKKDNDKPQQPGKKKKGTPNDFGVKIQKRQGLPQMSQQQQYTQRTGTQQISPRLMALQGYRTGNDVYAIPQDAPYDILVAENDQKDRLVGDERGSPEKDEGTSSPSKPVFDLYGLPGVRIPKKDKDSNNKILKKKNISALIEIVDPYVAKDSETKKNFVDNMEKEVMRVNPTLAPEPPTTGPKSSTYGHGVTATHHANRPHKPKKPNTAIRKLIVPTKLDIEREKKKKAEAKKATSNSKAFLDIVEDIIMSVSSFLLINLRGACAIVDRVDPLEGLQHADFLINPETKKEIEALQLPSLRQLWLHTDFDNKFFAKIVWGAMQQEGVKISDLREVMKSKGSKKSKSSKGSKGSKNKANSNNDNDVQQESKQGGDVAGASAARSGNKKTGSRRGGKSNDSKSGSSVTSNSKKFITTAKMANPRKRRTGDASISSTKVSNAKYSQAEAGLVCAVKLLMCIPNSRPVEELPRLVLWTIQNHFVKDVAAINSVMKEFLKFHRVGSSSLQQLEDPGFLKMLSQLIPEQENDNNENDDHNSKTTLKKGESKSKKIQEKQKRDALKLHWEKTQVFRKWHQQVKRKAVWPVHGVFNVKPIDPATSKPATFGVHNSMSITGHSSVLNNNSTINKDGVIGGDGTPRENGPPLWIHNGMRRYSDAAGWDSNALIRQTETMMKDAIEERLKVDALFNSTVSRMTLENRPVEPPRIINSFEDRAGQLPEVPHGPRKAKEFKKDRPKRTNPLAPTHRQRTMLIMAMFSDIVQTILLRSFSLLKQVEDDEQCPNYRALVQHFGTASVAIHESLFARLEDWLWNFVAEIKSGDLIHANTTYIELALQRSYSFWPQLQVMVEHMEIATYKDLKKKRKKDSDLPKVPTFITRFRWPEYHMVISNFKDPGTFIPSLQFL